MFCGKCGKKASEGAKFCGSCGATIAGSVPIILESIQLEQDRKESSNNTAVAEKSTPAKLRKNTLVFMLSFFILLGALSGVFGAMYVAKIGWENVPFAERLTFLPFVKFNKEKIEIYTVLTHNEVDAIETDVKGEKVESPSK